MKGGVQAKGGASKKANKKEKQKIEKETELQSQSRNTIKVVVGGEGEGVEGLVLKGWMVVVVVEGWG